MKITTRVAGPSPPKGLSSPLTPRGAGFLLLASALLLEGLLRSELGALLTGAGLGLAVLLSLVGVFWEARRQRRALSGDPEALELGLSAPVRDGSGLLRARLTIRNRCLPLPGFPGITARVTLRLDAGGGRRVRASALLPAPGSETETGVPEQKNLLRGVYRGGADLAAADAFGFCAIGRQAASGLETTALPEPRDARGLNPRREGGEGSDASDRLVRGEERFDSRPYLPGDDTRRINWKQYARFGDLYVRPGDLSPPPRRALRILVDTERPPYMSGEAGESYLDDIVEAVQGFIQGGVGPGTRVACSAPGLPDAPEDAAGRARWFSDLAWTTDSGDVRNGGGEALVVFGAPGALGRRLLLAERRSQGRKSLLVLPALSARAPRKGLYRFFFSTDPEAEAPPGRAFRSGFETALERDVRELGGSGGVDVRVI